LYKYELFKICVIRREINDNILSFIIYVNYKTHKMKLNTNKFNIRVNCVYLKLSNI